MKPDEGWPICLLKMAAHSILDHRLQFLECLRFGEDGMTEGSRLKTAFQRVFYEKNDLSVPRPDLLQSPASILPRPLGYAERTFIVV